MTRVLGVLGLVVLVGVILPAGVLLTLVLIADDRPFHDERVLVPPAGGVGVLANHVSVSLVPSRDAAVHVSTDGRFKLFGPQVKVGPEDAGTLSLPSPPSPGFDPTAGTGSALGVLVDGCWRCAITVTVAVPRGARIGVDGNVDTLTAVGVSGPLHLKTSSGAITGRDLSGPRVDADTGSGSVVLGLRVPASASAVTGSGDVTITAPPTSGYALEPVTGSGPVTATLPDDPSSPYHLVARTGSGAVVLTPP